MKHGAQTIVNHGGYLYEDGRYRCHGMVWPEARIFLPALFAIAAIIWWGSSQALSWYWIAFPALVMFLIGASVSWRFIIEPANGVVRRQAFLYAHRLLKEQLMPFTDFKCVFVDRNGPEGQEFRVLLEHISGRKMIVKFCGPEPRGAEELAWRISCDTGIRLKDQVS